jgi:hypothetical protein
MKTKARQLTPIAVMVLAFAFGSVSTRACVVAFPTVETGPSLRARAMDAGHPVAGLRLILLSDPPSKSGRRREIESLTDGNGSAEFRNLQPGSYILSADHDERMADSAIINVSPGGPPDVTITLQWPNSQPLQVRSLSGQMLAPSYYPGESQGPLSLSLLEGVSTHVIATVETNDQGRFAFPENVQPGLYFIRVNTSDGGLIGVALSPTAALKQLDGYLALSDCGLGFIQRHSLSPVTVSNICGDVLDSQGAPVRDARVIVTDIDRRGKILDQSVGDPRGGFALPGIAAGTYRMLVTSRGWVPYLREVHVQPAGSSGTCVDPMHVQLEPLI